MIHLILQTLQSVLLFPSLLNGRGRKTLRVICSVKWIAAMYRRCFSLLLPMVDYTVVTLSIGDTFDTNGTTCCHFKNCTCTYLKTVVIS